MDTDGGGGAAGQPHRADQQVHWVFEERGLVTFDRMTDKLQDPTDDKKRQRPAPVEKEQWERKHDHRNADAVRQFVQRMSMLGFVVFY